MHCTNLGLQVEYERILLDGLISRWQQNPFEEIVSQRVQVG